MFSLLKANDIDCIIQDSIDRASEWEKKKAQFDRSQKQRLLLVSKKAQGRATTGELNTLEALTVTCNQLAKEIRALDQALTKNSKELEKLTYP